ncbi:Glycogen synthase [Caulifigura coniformis]|uniref:Glycogen synthase n=1 Tax=Caulifigura coniformis TaxID=2527983 RepID=A0A517S884_9PLAN|nr:glycogen synthase GlgA [Caulifigura coniformis]QDT52337.1 Glycogen synthase [Caulifigura coniformis]
MRIVFASSEAVPFSKTGGLADVAAGLTKALAAAGHHVTLITPHYPRLFPPELPRLPTKATVQVPLGANRVTGHLLRSEFPDSNVDVVLIDQQEFFNRGSLYVEGGRDYPDNAERFLFFSRAVMEAIHRLNLAPDVIHANDWQTGLVTALVAQEYRRLPGCEQTANIFTIHNMAFQGRFHRDLMALTGIDWRHFNYHEMESYGDLNLLKTGIVFSDVVTTVSPTYANEITRAEFGYGLENTLGVKFDRLVGVLNGVDTTEWNPKIDPFLDTCYTASTVEAGKAACKAALQKELGLNADPDALLFGMVSRMADQKGFDLIAARIEDILKANVQFAFLGTGERRYEDLVTRLAQENPGRISASLVFSEGLAHRIEAGADAYLMPSRFEPCGLNQQYSLLYGTVPIVHRTGGLADTVVDARPETVANGTANGFVFDSYDPNSFLTSVWQCVGCFQHDKAQWRQLIQNGMREDRSWKRSAAEYAAIYERAIGWLK